MNKNYFRKQNGYSEIIFENKIVVKGTLSLPKLQPRASPSRQLITSSTATSLTHGLNWDKGLVMAFRAGWARYSMSPALKWSLARFKPACLRKGEVRCSITSSIWFVLFKWRSQTKGISLFVNLIVFFYLLNED